MRTLWISGVLSAQLLIVLSGCGSSSSPDRELGLVTGIVTLDGQPLEGASVIFTPTVQGAMSLGTTDTQGRYELVYSPGVKGAALGMHLVQISKVGGPDTKFDTMEMLPAEYNAQSKVTTEVKAGKNSFDYQLKSKSPSASGK